MGDSSGPHREPSDPWGNLYFLDWASLRSTSHSFTLEELSYYSTAGLDPYTVQIALAICPNFTITKHKQRTLIDIFNHSPIAESFGSETAKGHAMQRIVGSLTASDPGLVFLGICGVVGDYYHEDAAAEIFDDLAKCTGVPAQLAPSGGIWKTLTRAFSGLLSSTGFGVLVDKYTQLSHDLYEAERTGLEHNSSVGVIEILQAMSRLSRGVERGKGLQSMAGKDAGWVAAVAQWMFDLKVAVRGEIRGYEDLHLNDGGEVQMTIRFQQPGVPVDSPPIETTPLVVKERGERAN